MTERVVLAYSGGLDTSVAIGWIAEETGAEVIAVAADVGQGGEDLEAIRQRALACGAVESVVVDIREEFADEYCLPALKAERALPGPLPAGLRPVAAGHRQAPRRGGALPRRLLGRPRLHRQGQRPGALRGRHRRAGPGPAVLAPVRDSGMTRDKAIAFAEEKGLPIDVTKKSPYSIDQNLWGRAVETGFLEDIWNGPIEDVYDYTADPSVPRDADEVVITFERGRTGRDRRPARSRCWRRCWSSTRGPARRASAGSTWSRTGWSASRAARSTRRPARSR